MPRRIFSIGPPKHAEKPIIGAKTCVDDACQDGVGHEVIILARTATLIFATRSARELPIAKMVIPMIASESPKIRPNVCRTVHSV